MDTYAVPDQQRLYRARQQFLDGKPLPEDLLPASIARSWARSRDAGLLPWQPRLSQLDDQLHMLMPEDHLLARHASPEIERLWQVLGGKAWTIFCVNTEGVIVRIAKDQNNLPPLQYLQVGRRVHEPEIGTTAPSCTLMEGKPIVLLGNQHYLNEFERFFCVSVPLWGTQGELIGALDITGIGNRPVHSVLDQLNYAAMAVENRLYDDLPKTNILHLQHDPRLFDTPFEGLIALDSQGCIQAANRTARRLLGLDNQPLKGLRLDERFDTNLKTIIDNPTPELIRLADGSQLYIRNQSQRSAASLKLSTASASSGAVKTPDRLAPPSGPTQASFVSLNRPARLSKPTFLFCSRVKRGLERRSLPAAFMTPAALMPLL
ncbi:hypothetical protein IQ22_03614 [Pseudomonas duriflava]|uniref:PAS domain-containing protein n=1 Tax=Pseudomonas duriflava TaxID=459528 RepID=A0A562Q2K4_9PSED|nr:hypothetical protein IQ22_03614 [Pseudomonas duriflava]